MFQSSISCFVSDTCQTLAFQYKEYISIYFSLTLGARVIHPTCDPLAPGAAVLEGVASGQGSHAEGDGGKEHRKEGCKEGCQDGGAERRQGGKMPLRFAGSPGVCGEAGLSGVSILSKYLY